jgi:RNA polymerase sigma-70 factor, ECF subfamily
MHDDGPGDEILVARARGGSSEAFDALVRRYARAVHAVALSVVGSHADAEDVGQDAWVRALERLEDCRDPRRFAGWLLRIVRNRALNHLKYRRVRAAAALEDAFGPEGPAGDSDPHRDLRDTRLRERLEAALVTLPEAQREVLVLHDLAGWDHAAIAAHAGISENLSRQRLFQARARMRKRLGEDTPVTRET